MGAWAYCNECDCPLSKPTLRQLFEKEQRCRTHGHCNQPTGDIAEAMQELEDKVDFLMALAAEVGRVPD